MTEDVAQRLDWTWWWCRMRPKPHCKIRSNRQPICPVCHVPMDAGEMTVMPEPLGVLPAAA